MLGNFAMRLAMTLSGQLLAFDAAVRLVTSSAWTAMVIGLVGACFNGASLLGMPVAGRLADVHGHERVLAWSPLLGVIATGAVTLAALANLHGGAGVSFLLLVRVAEGVAAAAVLPPMLTLLSRATEHDASARTRVMGLFEITGLIGLSLGLLLAALLWDRLRTHALLVLAPSYALALPFLARRTGASTPARTAAAPSMLVTLRSLASQRQHVLFAMLWLTLNAVVGLWLQYVPYLLVIARPAAGQQVVGSVSGASASLLFVVVGLLYAGGTAAWSFLASRWTRRAMLAVSVSGIVGMAGSLALVNHGAWRLWMVAVALCLAVQGGITPAALGLVADLTADDDHSRGTTMGAYSFLLGVGQFFGGVLGGPFVARWQLDGLLAMSAVLGLVSLLMLGILPVHRPVTAPERASLAG
jgi:MFS family permease